MAKLYKPTSMKVLSILLTTCLATMALRVPAANAQLPVGHQQLNGRSVGAPRKLLQGTGTAQVVSFER
jgi:hypothetical protein